MFKITAAVGSPPVAVALPLLRMSELRPACAAPPPMPMLDVCADELVLAVCANALDAARASVAISSFIVGPK